MPQHKILIRTTPTFQVYEIRDDATNALVCISSEPILTADQQRQQSIQDKAAQALIANNTFLTLSSPTNAQVLAQVQRLTRENNALIRLVLSQFDADDA